MTRNTQLVTVERLMTDAGTVPEATGVWEGVGLEVCGGEGLRAEVGDGS